MRIEGVFINLERSPERRRVGEVVDGFQKKVGRRDEIRVENRDKFAAGRLEAFEEARP